MKIAIQSWPRRCAATAVAALALLAWMQPTWADEPMLTICQAGGESSIYPVSEITRMGFEGDTLMVVSAGGTDIYAAEAIIRIEFLWDFSAIGDPQDAATPLKGVHLFQNQPNPFSPATQIRFELPRAGWVKLGIHTVDGRLIRTLVDEERTAGPHSVRWDGCNGAGRKVSGGVYFYNLTASGIEESRQMILLP